MVNEERKIALSIITIEQLFFSEYMRDSYLGGAYESTFPTANHHTKD